MCQKDNMNYWMVENSRLQASMYQRKLHVSGLLDGEGVTNYQEYRSNWMVEERQQVSTFQEYMSNWMV
jgi:hypothetical protein